MLHVLRRCATPRRAPAAWQYRAWSSTYRGPAAVVVIDGVALDGWTGTSREFLGAHPRGAYTTARTVKHGAAVFELDAHIDRTAESLRLMHGAALDAALEPAAFREQFVGTMAAALRCFYAQGNDTALEARVTVLAAWEDDTLRFFCHASQLPPPPPSPVIVEVRGSPRSTAAAKDSAWVTARQGLEQLRGSDVDEIILCGVDGELMEGSQTNFYALHNGAVWTAGEGALAGTVRSLVLRSYEYANWTLGIVACSGVYAPVVGVCAQHDVEVVFEPPNLRDLHSWDGCLISSTSRLLLPIDTCAHPSWQPPCHIVPRRLGRSLAVGHWEGIPWDDSIDDSRTFSGGEDKDSLGHSLVEWLAEEVDDSSVAILNQTVR